ncbi:MAG: hypothetical protein FJX20_11850 [Alphaproteobacteria bacterium]|nr:hypothetical protein [Alphaproteobacteria bacterium]
MSGRALLWFAMGVAMLAAAPALAETRPIQPKNPGVTQKGQDAPPKVQPSQTKPKAPPGKTKPFMSGGSDGIGI